MKREPDPARGVYESPKTSCFGKTPLRNSSIPSLALILLPLLPLLPLLLDPAVFSHELKSAVTKIVRLPTLSVVLILSSSLSDVIIVVLRPRVLQIRMRREIKSNLTR